MRWVATAMAMATMAVVEAPAVERAAGAAPAEAWALTEAIQVTAMAMGTATVAAPAAADGRQGAATAVVLRQVARAAAVARAAGHPVARARVAARQHVQPRRRRVWWTTWSTWGTIIIFQILFGVAGTVTF